MSTNGLKKVVLGLLVILMAGCGSFSRSRWPEAGRTQVFEAGLPNFDLEANVLLRDGEPVVDIYASIPIASLVFVQTEDTYQSKVELIYRLLDRRGRQLIKEEIETHEYEVNDYDSTLQGQPRLIRHRMTCLPGEYLVEVMVTDTKSDKSTVRWQTIEVPDESERSIFMSGIQVQEITEDKSAHTLASLRLPAGGAVELQASVEFINTSGRDLEVEMNLVRFRTDTTVAQPPYWLGLSRGSLLYWGVDYKSTDTVQVSRRSVPQGSSDPVEIAFQFPPLQDGVHRITVAVKDPLAPDKKKPLLTRERQFLATDPSFPEIRTLDQMIEALVYIAEEKEIEYIRAGKTPIERKERFDAFWGSLVKNRERAASLIALYYGRVEEANRLYTTHKPGWKTDRGMVSIILGSPVYVESEGDREIWHYSTFEMNGAFDSFVFERTPLANLSDPFGNWVLQRRNAYHQSWNRAVARWREGRVL